MNKKKIYIAGKVSGLPFHDVVGKFAKAYDQIVALGFEAVNPVELVQDYLHAHPENLESTEEEIWQLAMKLCIKELVDCDAIVLLEDWTLSKGARFEYDIAKELNIPNYRASVYGFDDMLKDLAKWNS
jgi:hypothetical protein